MAGNNSWLHRVTCPGNKHSYITEWARRPEWRVHGNQGNWQREHRKRVFGFGGSAFREAKTAKANEQVEL